MTHAAVDARNLQEAILQLLSERFRGVKIVSVTIENEAFHDDEVIELTVVFEGTRDDLVKGVPSGLYGIVRDKVADFCRRDAPSPVFNFISAVARA